MSLMCGLYVYKLSVFTYEGIYYEYVAKVLELLRQPLPHECVDSLWGDNVFGDFFRQHTTNPKKNRECLVTVRRQVPDHTLRCWPVPIPGVLL